MQPSSLVSASLVSVQNDAPEDCELPVVSFAFLMRKPGKYAPATIYPHQRPHHRFSMPSLSIGTLQELHFHPLAQFLTLQNFNNQRPTSQLSKYSRSNYPHLNLLISDVSPLFKSLPLKEVKRLSLTVSRLDAQGLCNTVCQQWKVDPTLLLLNCTRIIPSRSTLFLLLLYELRAAVTGESVDSICVSKQTAISFLTTRSLLLFPSVQTPALTQLEDPSLVLSIKSVNLPPHATVVPITLLMESSYDLSSILVVDGTTLSPTFDASWSVAPVSSSLPQNWSNVTDNRDDVAITKPTLPKARLRTDVHLHTPRPYSHARPFPTRTAVSDFATAAISRHDQARECAVHTCIPVVRSGGSSNLAFCAKCRLVIPLPPKPLGIHPPAIDDPREIEKRVSGESSWSTNTTSTVASDGHSVDSISLLKNSEASSKNCEQPTDPSPTAALDLAADNATTSSVWHGAFRWPHRTAASLGTDKGQGRFAFFTYPVQKLLTQMTRRRYVVPLYPWKWRRPALCGL